MQESNHSHAYWLDVPLIQGEMTPPSDGGIAIVGTGLAGVSVAYWLLENGFNDITLLDFEAEKSASFRNCGHILYGTVESMSALCSIHGRELAQKIWNFSIDICHTVRETVKKNGFDIDYKQDGYYVVAIDEAEDAEVQKSVTLLNQMGFQSDYIEKRDVEKLGFKNVFGARFEQGSAQAHPTKFRNALLKNVLERGVKYFSGVKVEEIEGESDGTLLKTNRGDLRFEASVIAANAYSPLLSHYFREKRLIEPFRGQIITSRPLRHNFKVKQPHSFDHGYEYAIVTEDNRLMIGGWRNHTSGETGTYDITPNPYVEEGLKDFVKKHYDITEKVEWEYSWAGIMGASKTGFPFIGPLSHPRIFTCSGFTGHGFSWAHGSAKLLADIIAGNESTFFTQLFRADGI